MGFTDKQRLVIAGAIAVGGGLLALQAYLRVSGAGSGGSGASDIVLSEAAEAISVLDFDTEPTAESVDAVVATARERAAASARDVLGSIGGLPAGADENLLDAFGERLSMTLDGDFERNIELLRARGDRSTPEQVEAMRDARIAWSEHVRLARVSLSGVSTRVVYERGRRVAPDDTELGLSVTTSTPSFDRFGVPLDAEGGKLTVVEVRILVEQHDVEHGKPRPTVVGYQFAWSPGRRQWIPWKNVTYYPPGAAHFAMQF